MYKEIIEKYEKDGYESAKKSFMDFVNADRSDVTKDEVMLSYAMMVKLALVNKDNEMAEKLLRLDSKFADSSEKSQLDSKTDEPRDKPEKDNSANVINILGMEFVELSPKVYVSRKTISDADLKRIGVHNNIIGSWNKANAACDIMSNLDPYYNFRLPTEEEFLDIIECHKIKGIQLEPPSAYEWTSTINRSRKGHIYHVAHDSEGGRKDLGVEYGYGENVFRVPVGGAIINVDTAFRLIAELKH